MFALTPARLTQKLLLILLALTPLFSLFEVIALFEGTIKSQAEALTPPFIKVLRDIGWILAILLGTVRILLQKRFSPYLLLCMGLVALSIYAAATSLLLSPYLAASGIRWVIPTILVFFLIDQIDEQFIRRAYVVMRVLLILQLAVQFGQFFFASDWYGKNALGFAARSPGFFLIPSTGAFFTILCFFLSQFYATSRTQKVIVGILCFVSTLLTASGTGYMVFAAVLLLIFVGQRYVRVALPVILVFGALSFPFLMQMTGRGDNYAQISFGSRVDTFIDSVEHGTVLPGYFGLGTNTGVLLGSSLDLPLQARILDSTFTSILVNLGFLGFGIFLMLLILWIGCVMYLNKLELYAFTVIFVCFGAVTIVPECFPANLLFAALMAYYSRRYVRFGFDGQSRIFEPRATATTAAE